MGARAEGLACADPGARTPIGASGIPSYSYHRGDYPEYKLMRIFLSVCARKILSYIRRRYHTKSADAGELFQNPGILMDDFVNYLKNKIFFYLPVSSCSFTLWKFLNVTCFSSLGTISVVIPSISEY